jgi:hypothetical protein
MTPHSEQSKEFVKAARELGCDEDPAHFEEKLKKVARHKPRHDVANDGALPAKEQTSKIRS